MDARLARLGQHATAASVLLLARNHLLEDLLRRLDRLGAADPATRVLANAAYSDDARVAPDQPRGESKPLREEGDRGVAAFAQLDRSPWIRAVLLREAERGDLGVV